MGEQEVKVSVLCTAYNHEEYIEEAVKSFLMQKTTFKFEILIHDDASTDRTAEIIKNYEKEYPDIIKGIYQVENQYSQGIDNFTEYLIPNAKGTYIAVCEGDDYWTDCNKLQKQYDLLERNPSVNICAHNAIVVNAKTGAVFEKKYVVRDLMKIASVEEVILGDGGFVATNSLFFRKSIYNEEPEFCKMMRYDYTLQINGSLHGGMLCLPDFMAAYRFAVSNSVSQMYRSGNERIRAFFAKKHDMLAQLDKETDYIYHDAITGKILLDDIVVENKAIDNIRILSKYKNGFHVLAVGDKVRVLIKCFCPVVLRLKHKLIVSKRNKIMGNK
ncbi:MAG: glycosyltransferase [Agathobacter sp.]|nr:glycosyltransferase [Agathobacter sp.]